MSADRVTYLDSSAIVKLVVREPETSALRRYVHRYRPLVSSALARTEVARAMLSLGGEYSRRSADVLARIELIRINDRVLAAAGQLQPAELRVLDAIHLATASLLGQSLARLVTYDHRMTDTAKLFGWHVVSPT